MSGSDLAHHNQLQSIRLLRLKEELRTRLGREPSAAELAHAITNGFGEYFAGVNSELNRWATGEEIGCDPRAMAPEAELDALEKHHQKFCGPLQCSIAEDSP